MSRFQKLHNLTAQRKAFGLTLHIGTKAKTQEGKEYPKSVDYFIADGAFAERFALLNQEWRDETDKKIKPRSLNIMFFPPDVRQVCRIFQEYRDSAGVVRGRVFVDWFSKDKVEKFVIYTPQDTNGVEVAESEFTTYTSRYKANTGVDTLQLIFMLQKFLENGVYTFCQIQTKADDSSIPGIVSVLEDMDARNKIDMPYILSVSLAKNKGMKADGTAEAHQFPVLSLHPDFSQKAIESRNTAVLRFLELSALPTFDRPQAQLNGNTQHANALSAAPEHIEHAQVIDGEVVDAEPDTAAPDNEVITALVERGNVLIQQSGNPQIETWWNGVLATRNIEKVRGAIDWMEKKAAEKAALKPEHLDQPAPAAEMREHEQEG